MWLLFFVSSQNYQFNIKVRKSSHFLVVGRTIKFISNKFMIQGEEKWKEKSVRESISYKKLSFFIHKISPYRQKTREEKARSFSPLIHTKDIHRRKHIKNVNIEKISSSCACFINKKIDWVASRHCLKMMDNKINYDKLTLYIEIA